MANSAVPIQGADSQQKLCGGWDLTGEAVPRVSGGVIGATAEKMRASEARALGLMGLRHCAAYVAHGSERGTHHLLKGTRMGNTSVRNAAENMIRLEG